MVTAFQAIILGFVQGLTEFLPVSSSGHLVIVQSLLGVTADLISFDAFIHLGTLVAVCTAFWKDILALLKKPICRFTGLLILSCIPVGLAGLFLDSFVRQLFESLTSTAIALIITGILMMISDRINGHKTIDDLKIKDAILIGVFQGLAITPGLSRSGSCIFGSLLCGLNRKDAAKYAFILSIPVIVAAAGKEVFLLYLSSSVFEFSWTYVLGAAVAAVTGHFAIKVLLRLLEKRNMRYFSYYVWLLGAGILISRIFV